ncbi:MAG: ribosome biogenesis GTP-binding protein YihA/YsxC [Bacteroidales bacterium]|jgi:GTP-binding protein|nr:ribosome biogenesis GTP-binding protein YihA/YsxC [Bacteroidales bacterium]
MSIKKSEFVKSSQNCEQCPKVDKPEYAFIGRSNVGKSSLINMITERKHLAKVSSTPGKTQLINHFIIDDEWYLVDLPGYGFAKKSKTLRESFSKIITDYVTNRQDVICFFVLVDIRHSAQKVDLEFMRMLGEGGVPFAIVFTKADKLGKIILKQKVEDYKKVLLTEWEELPEVFVTSSLNSLGRDELVEYIRSVNKVIAKG